MTALAQSHSTRHATDVTLDDNQALTTHDGTNSTDYNKLDQHDRRLDRITLLCDSLALQNVWVTRQMMLTSNWEYERDIIMTNTGLL
eukprot:1184359-Karenia_brevis.AAC.1